MISSDLFTHTYENMAFNSKKIKIRASTEENYPSLQGLKQ